MINYDIHNDKQGFDRIKYDLDIQIKFAKREKDRLLCLIVGYGSTGGTHKIKNNAIEILEEYKKNNRIKDYLLGDNLDIFNPLYQSFKGKDNIPSNLKNINPGIIIILV